MTICKDNAFGDTMFRILQVESVISSQKELGLHDSTIKCPTVDRTTILHASNLSRGSFDV